MRNVRRISVLAGTLLAFSGAVFCCRQYRTSQGPKVSLRYGGNAFRTAFTAENFYVSNGTLHRIVLHSPMIETSRGVWSSAEVSRSWTDVIVAPRTEKQFVLSYHSEQDPSRVRFSLDEEVQGIQALLWRARMGLWAKTSLKRNLRAFRPPTFLTSGPLRQYKELHAEPVGPATGSQPIRPDTDTTAVAAGSRR